MVEHAGLTGLVVVGGDKQQPVGYAMDLCMRIVEAVKTELKMPKLDVKFVPVTSSNRIPALL